MKNIQLRKPSSSKNTFDSLPLPKRQVKINITQIFSLPANPKGDWCVSTFHCANAHKNFSKEGEHISRTSSYVDKPIHYKKIIYRKEFIMKKEVITVFTAKKARKLLKEGYTIVDIKPDRLDPDHKRTLFLFKNEDGLIKKIFE